MASDSSFHRFSTYILLIQTLVLGGVALYLFIAGVPPSWKRYVQDEVLEQMGDMKAKDVLKGVVDQVPEAEFVDGKMPKGVRKDVKNKLPDAGKQALDKLGL